MKRSYIKLLIDGVMAVVLILLMEPHATGLSVHEWGGLVVCLAFLVHVLLNWKWVATMTVKFFTRIPMKSRVNYCLDVLLVVGFFLTVLSGLPIAKTINFSWVSLPGTWPFWRGLHGFAALLTLIVAGVHLGLHWKWIACHVKRNTQRKNIVQEVSHA